MFVPLALMLLLGAKLCESSTCQCTCSGNGGTGGGMGPAGFARAGNSGKFDFTKPWINPAEACSFIFHPLCVIHAKNNYAEYLKLYNEQVAKNNEILQKVG